MMKVDYIRIYIYIYLVLQFQFGRSLPPYWERVDNSRHGGQSRRVSSHILNHKQRAKRENYK